MSEKRTRKLPVKKFHKTFDLDGVPFCLKWSVEDVADWVEIELEFPQYKECFQNNFVSGKKLIHMTASTLPRIGITDFNHIKMITSEIRTLLGIEQPSWNRSIILPPKDTVEHFIERKSISGKESDSLSFAEHVQYLKNFKKHGVPEDKLLWTT